MRLSGKSEIKINILTLHNVISEYVHVVISVRSILFMPEPYDVSNFVYHDTGMKTTIAK